MLTVTIPAPRAPAETARTPGRHRSGCGPRSVRDDPGWVSLVEALDGAVAAMIARVEQELCHADSARAARLRHQLVRILRLEALTAAAADRARRTPPGPLLGPLPGSGPEHDAQPEGR